MEVTTLVLNFLVAIQGVESDHGKKLNHPIITNPKSIHFGDSAIGRFGLMPNTILEMKGDVERFKIDKNYKFKLSKKYALKVLKVAKGCPLDASILWLRGPAARILPDDYKTPRYTKFVKEWERFFGPINRDKLILRYCK